MVTSQPKPTLEEVERQVSKPGPRVALITPYDGGNLGDAAIQDSMISNLRLRMPGAQFTGITLNCDNFLQQHGVGAYPLLATMMSSSNQHGRNSTQQADGEAGSKREAGHAGFKVNPIRRALGSVPGLVPFLKMARTWVRAARREISHCYQGYRVLRTQDALFVSGGGQLDEEYGGPWRLPYTIFKWTLLARLARVPCAMASIGAGRIVSPTSRRFVSMALGLCRYRSFREQRSRTIVASLFPRAANDPVVPDLAFSMPESEFQTSARAGAIRRMARGRPILALSPIAYAKPINWPTSDRALYSRYVKEMAEILRGLSRRGNFIVVVCSSLGDDESVIPDILERLDEEMKHDMDGNIHFPKIKTWREFATVIRETDCLIASRLHGTILGFLSKTPVIAISFDPKVDWVMEDLQQDDCLLHIRDFTADDVMHALDRVKSRRDVIVEQIVSYRRSVLFSSPSARQYDLLAGLALRHHQSHN